MLRGDSPDAARDACRGDDGRRQRVGAQMAMLEFEALAETGGSGSPQGTRIAIAVNAGSMSTWFTAVFGQLPNVLFDIRIEDQDHSARLLREGAVMGAVTTERTPMPGCRLQSLGVMRHVPVASAEYVASYLPDGFSAEAVANAPSLAWNRADALQDMLVRKAFRRTIARRVHYVPTAEGFGDAVRAGLGWGMHLDQLAAPCCRTARLSGILICILMCHCSGSAGSWKVRRSRRSPEAVRTGAIDLHRSLSLGHRSRSSDN